MIREASPRWIVGDFKCNHDETHRVCAKLVNQTSGEPISWGTGDFWEITDQKRWQWSDVRSRPRMPRCGLDGLALTWARVAENHLSA